MTIHEMRDDVDLLHEILTFLKANLDASTALLATTRGHRNSILLAGTFLGKPTAPFTRSFSVPFAAVAFVDSNSLGLNISTGQGGETEGPGVIIASAGAAGCLPLLGDRIAVTPASSGSFFLAVFSRLPGLAFGVT